MLTGGCFCGHVRYAADGTPFHATLCHCAMCRRIAGAPMVAWFTIPRAGFRLTAGEPTRFASSDRARRSFCPRCGTPLTFESAALPEEVDITTASLDRPEAVPPADQCWAASRIGWVHLDAALPAFPAARPEG